MIYLYDIVFILILLCFKRVITAIMENDLVVFFMTRESYTWMEYLFMLVCVIYMPYHSPTEAVICIIMGVLTKWFFDNSTHINRFFNWLFKPKPNPVIKWYKLKDKDL